MGRMMELTAADGHKFEAYLCEPAGKPRGALVVLMEIFGVNSHIKHVAEDFAKDGYLAIAPQMFDRVQRGLDIGYTAPEIEIGRGIMQKMKLEDAMKDIAAAIDQVKSAGKVGIVGYCWGGTAAWKAACSVPGLACSLPYYGGGIPGLIGEKPKCPVMFHWGETDHSIPLEKAREVAAAHADQIHYFYPAGHGFSCNQRGSYDDASSKLARTRTMDFLAKHVG
jgi:carboxymethylenebutenolidase